MAYLDHVATCNAHDMSRFRPFLIDGVRVGWVRHDIARLLAGFPNLLQVSAESIALRPSLATPEARAAALDEIGRTLNRNHGTPALRGERYRVAARWGDPVLTTIDRGMVSLFGVRAVGIHVNGLVQRPDGLHLWVGRRAANKPVAPNKLDNLVAGGQPAGLGLKENLLKEAAEEADISADLASTARPAGMVSYCMEDEWGLKPDVMFCYDLDLPEDFVPHNTDGELAGFMLWPIADVARQVRDTDEFKFNVNLVIIDLMVRNGLIDPDSEPDYVEIVRGLRRE
jgi:hypothetical protein